MSSQKCSLQLSLLLVAAHVREFLMRFFHRLDFFKAYFKQENEKFDCEQVRRVGRDISASKKNDWR